MDVAIVAQADASLIDAARAGDPDAQGDLAVALFRSGDRHGAMPWVRQAAAVGEPRCQYLLGIALFNGDGVRQDRNRAVALLAEARDAGVAAAGEALGLLGATPPARLMSGTAATAAGIQFDRLRTPAAIPQTLDGLLASLIRPMLRDGLDPILPAAIERAVDAAIDQDRRTDRNAATS